MNRARTAGAPAVSQFQLIGGVRHEAADCLTIVEPGGAVQNRKGALYVVSEPAGDSAHGGEACGLAQQALAHEYYADPSPSVTTSLSAALNKANIGLIHYNRQTLAASDPAPGLPRKIRVGLSAAIVRPGQLYLCQLRPGLILWTHGGVVNAYPRPRGWKPQSATVNGDGEIVGSFYAAPALGTGPVVEADFAFRRFDSGDLLILCSSNLAAHLDEAALAEALPGKPAPEVCEYLFNLARAADLADAHALVVELSSAPISNRTTRPVALPAPPAWAPEPPPEPPPAPEPALPPADSRIIQLRPRSRPAAPPAEAPAPPPGAAPDAEQAAVEAPPAAPAGPGPARKALTGVMGGARKLGRRAAPVVGTAGKATLGAAGAVMSHTLPENVRRRGAAGILSPEDEAEYEDDDQEFEDDVDADVSDNRVVDFDAPGHAPAPAAPPFPLLRWLVPIAAVLLLGVLLLIVQQIISGQQATKIDGLLAQAQQAEVDSQEGSAADRRDHLLKASELVQQAQAIDPRSSNAKRLADRVQGELDTLNNVTRLSGLTLLFDSDKTTVSALAAASATPAVEEPTATPPVSDTLAAPPIGAPAPGGDYFSQAIVHGDDAFLLNKGNGRLYRLSLSSRQFTALLGPGDAVDMVGQANGQGKVGQLLFATWRPTAEGGDLAVVDDGQIAYVWTPSTGQWQGFALGGQNLLRPRDLGAYDGNLYELWAQPGQVSKWPAGGYTNAAVDWLSPGAANEIRSRNPVAMAIDGDIYLLLGDGRITTLSAGEVASTRPLDVWPQAAIPLAIFTSETTQSLYVVEVYDKRIIRVDKATGAVQAQLKAPSDSDAFDALRNVYVDEGASKIYVLSGKRLYVAPLPPLAPGPGTPAAPSAAPAPSPSAPPDASP
jgi:hypothetical protein